MDRQAFTKGVKTMDRLLSIAETREALGGIGRTALWELDKSGQIRGVKIGRRKLYPASEIDRLVTELAGEHRQTA
jgi:hypothetical protein